MRAEWIVQQIVIKVIWACGQLQAFSKEFVLREKAHTGSAKL